MNRLDKALRQWSKGVNTTSHMGVFTLTRVHLYHHGVSIAFRARNSRNKNVIFTRDCYGSNKIDSRFDPKKHIIGEWCNTTEHDYLTLVDMLTHLDKTIDNPNLSLSVMGAYRAGHMLFKLRNLLERLGIEHTFVCEERHADLTILGLKVLLRGKVEAVVYHPEYSKWRDVGFVLYENAQTKIDYCDQYILFPKIEDAMIHLLSHNDLKLVDLTKADDPSVGHRVRPFGRGRNHIRSSI